MTCKDCKYYKPINDKEGKCNSPMDAYYGFDTTVVGDLGKCDYFISKDGTYHNGTEHCPRCGKAVDKWGLCGECESLYKRRGFGYSTNVSASEIRLNDSWEGVNK